MTKNNNYNVKSKNQILYLRLFISSVFPLILNLGGVNHYCTAFVSLLSPRNQRRQRQRRRRFASRETTIAAATIGAQAFSKFQEQGQKLQEKHQPHFDILDPIMNHPSIRLLQVDNMNTTARKSRKKMKSRHIPYFQTSTASNTTTITDNVTANYTTNNNNNTNSDPVVLFEKVAIACCESSVVPRKEFYETYAAATVIYHTFFGSNGMNNKSMNNNDQQQYYRIADLAAGHGLLSWILLAMDDYYSSSIYHNNDDNDDDDDDNNNGRSSCSSSRRRMTAICVDLRMPPSAIAIAKSMRKHFFPILINNKNDNDNKQQNRYLDKNTANIKKATTTINVIKNGDTNNDDDDDDEQVLYDQRWTYVETSLHDIVADNSTVLLSVHACGTLSDYIIDMAISANKAPVALVPCCHTYSKRKGYQPHSIYANGITTDDVTNRIMELQQQQQQKLQLLNNDNHRNNSTATYYSTNNNKKSKKFQIIEDVIDEVRFITLQNAYDGGCGGAYSASSSLTTNISSSNVQIQTLPDIFTERNRLFLVTPTTATRNNHSNNDNYNNHGEILNREDQQPQLDTKKCDTGNKNTVQRDNRQKKEKGEEQQQRSNKSKSAGIVPKIGFMPQLTVNNINSRKASLISMSTRSTNKDNNNNNTKKIFQVPLMDDRKSIEYCVSVSGKIKAKARLRMLLPNHFATRLDVSMWLPISSTNSSAAINDGDDDDDINRRNGNEVSVTIEMLQDILNDCVRSYFMIQKAANHGIISASRDTTTNKVYYYCCCIIRPIKDIYYDSKTKRFSGTYQIEYKCDPIITSSSDSNRNGNSKTTTISSKSSTSTGVTSYPNKKSSSSRSSNSNNHSRVVIPGTYVNDDGSFPKKTAKEIHQLFCEHVGTISDDVEIR